MIVLAGGVIGAIWGVLAARRQEGNRKDQAQYAIAFTIAGLLLGLVATIVIERLVA